MPESGPATLDLVVSGLALQLVNDLPGALIQIRHALKPDGLMLATLLGAGSLVELREGDWVLLPAGCRHRVEWTTPDGPTVWLALDAGEGVDA